MHLWVTTQLRIIGQTQNIRRLLLASGNLLLSLKKSALIRSKALMATLSTCTTRQLGLIDVQESLATMWSTKSSQMRPRRAWSASRILIQGASPLTIATRSKWNRWLQQPKMLLAVSMVMMCRKHRQVTSLSKMTSSKFLKVLSARRETTWGRSMTTLLWIVVR